MSGLEYDYPGEVKAQNVDATTPESKAEVEALGFSNHGLVIRSHEGDVLWKQPDHEVVMDDAKEFLDGHLGKG